jgi:hypothetical protein
MSNPIFIAGTMYKFQIPKRQIPNSFDQGHGGIWNLSFWNLARYFFTGDFSATTLPL